MSDPHLQDLWQVAQQPLRAAAAGWSGQGCGAKGEVQQLQGTEGGIQQGTNVAPVWTSTVQHSVPCWWLLFGCWQKCTQA